MAKLKSRTLILIISAVCILILLYALRSIIWIVVAACVLAYLVDPLAEATAKRFGRRWGFAALLGMLLCVLAGVIAMFPLLIGELRSIAARLPDVIQWLDAFLSELNRKVGFDMLSTEVILGSFDAEFFKNTLSTAAKSVSRYAVFVMAPVIAIYFIKDKKYFLRTCRYLIPVKYREEVGEVAKRIHYDLKRYIRGQFIVMFAVGSLTTIGLYITGMPNALALGFIMALLNIIPYIGPWLGALPIAVTGVLNGLKPLLAGLAVVLAVQQIDNNFISPKVIGDSVSIHPVYVILSILAFSVLFGFAGVLLAVPSLIIIKQCLEHFLNRKASINV